MLYTPHALIGKFINLEGSYKGAALIWVKNSK